jgi:signal transduction histidine kinase
MKQLGVFLCGVVVALLAVLPVVQFVFRRHLRQAHQAKDSQGRQLEELGKLTGGLAHEIKNPLSTIKINLKLIREDVEKSGQEQPRWFRKITVVEKETARVEQILDDFLRYVGKADIRPTRTDLNELVREMIDFYIPQAQSHKVLLRANLSDGELSSPADSDLLKQVILNLLINSVQAMGDGGEIIVRTYARGQRAIIEVSDTGPGVKAEHLDRIFDAYFTTRPNGSGLGLPIARKIITAHNGYITVNSKEGVGTSFSIDLPMTS